MTVVALQMDDIYTIDVETDTTFALALEAQKRGLSLFYYQPQDLFLECGVIKAKGHFIHITDASHDYVTLESQEVFSLHQADYVLIRQNPPFNLAYITTTHLLELLPSTTKVINNPQGIRNAPEKLLVTHFQDLTPPTLIARDGDVIESFIETHQTVVLKPLFEFGGKGVFKLTSGDTNTQSIIELFHHLYEEPFIVQKFIPEIIDGDKRILLVNGEPIGVFNRLPQLGQTRSNMRVGGQPQACDYTQRDLEICERIGPVLREMGLFFVGIDVIGSYLTEINVTSPTGLRVMNRLYESDLATQFWDNI